MKKIALCLGYFDSVHLGHRELIKRCSNYAASHGMQCAVYTFSEDKVGLFDSLYPFEERKALIKGAGANLIISEVFSRSFRQMTGEEFLDHLTSDMSIKAFFCGHDFTFGRDASCNVRDLADYARHNEIYCEIMPLIESDGEKVSTSRIKRLIKDGSIEKANELLVIPYHMTGVVERGRGVGRNFGFPTANISHGGFLPKEGVYKTKVRFDGKTYIGVTNIGPRPTFDLCTVSVETMIIDFSGDLYGKEITVEFLKYLRPISKFKDGNELNKQIQKDIKEALC